MRQGTTHSKLSKLGCIALGAAWAILWSAVPAGAQTTLLVTSEGLAGVGVPGVYRYNIDTDGNWSFTGMFAHAGDGSSMALPSGIAYSNNKVYVSDIINAGGSRILEYDLDGNFQGVLTTFAGERPDKLLVAPDGNLLTSNPFGTGSPTDHIMKVDVVTGAYSTFIETGTPATHPYQLVNPRSLRIVGSDLYLSNRNGMGTQPGGGSVLRFNATTGEYLDADIGPNNASINDDVFFDVSRPQSLTYDSEANALYVASIGAPGGELYDVYRIDLSSIGAPPLESSSNGVTKIYDMQGMTTESNNYFLDMLIANGRMYATAYADHAVWEIIPATPGNPNGSHVVKIGGVARPHQFAEIPFQNLPELGSNWGASGSGSWHNSGNWLGGIIPNAAGATAIFGDAIAANSTVVLDAAATVGHLRFNHAAASYVLGGTSALTFNTASGNATLRAAAGSHQVQVVANLAKTLDLEVAAGSTLSFNNAFNLNGQAVNKTGGGRVNVNNLLHSGGGTVNVVEGVLGGNGAVGGNVNNQSGGTVAPGASIGILDVAGNYAQSSGATLAIELAGATTGSFDVLNVTGTATLAGVLNIALIDRFSPTNGQMFEVLTAANVVNSGLMLAGASAGFSLQFSPTAVMLSYSGATLPGDFDNNGLVDGNDLLVWQRDPNVGSLSDWKTNFGLTTLQPTATAIPEPSSLVALLVAGGCVLGVARNPRGKRS